MSYLDEISEVWNLVFSNIAAKKGRSFTDLWFKDIKIYAYDGNTLTFSTDSEFKYDTIKRTHIEILKTEFADFLPCDIDIVFLGGKQASPVEEAVAQKNGQKNNISEQPYEEYSLDNDGIKINPDYTFENFIVGGSNKFAHAACTAVAQRPAQDYNPLFIYGPSGLGKTHLICAIVNEIKKKRKNTKVVYINGEDFTNQLVESISRKNTAEFHNRFRSCDILLIDDIQFIAGKDSTQEEFFHTFNTLHSEQKQIILTSDRPPKDIATLEERLRTRFEWGLIADIQPPDLELRLAIFKQKVAQEKIDVSDDVLLFLAENLRSNIRQIEGAIKKLKAKSFLLDQKISMELAKSCINELLGGAEPMSVTIDKIFSAVFKKYNVSKEEIKGKNRVKNVTWARQVFIYLVREITELSFPDIGDIINKDHSSVIYSNNQIAKKRASDPLVNIEIENLMKEISG